MLNYDSDECSDDYTSSVTPERAGYVPECSSKIFDYADESSLAGRVNPSYTMQKHDQQIATTFSFKHTLKNEPLRRGVQIGTPVFK